MSAVRARPAARGDFTRSLRAAKYILSKSPLRPKIAVVLGSGLGAFAAELAAATRIPYGKISGFPKPTAEGHAGQLVIGKVNDIAVAVMQGRVHSYEGYSPKEVVYPMRVLRQLGIQAAILTNAAGAINLTFKPGDLVVISDHISLHSINPLIGPNDDRFGTRFPDMSEAYFKPYREIGASRRKETRHRRERGSVRRRDGAKLRDARRNSLPPHHRSRHGRHVNRAGGHRGDAIWEFASWEFPASPTWPPAYWTSRSLTPRSWKQESE